jgi:predicted dehydrogenase
VKPASKDAEAGMNAETANTRLTITVAGSGAAADRWDGAFRALDDVATHHIDGASEEALLAHFAETSPDAVVFVTPAIDLPGGIKRALMARRHVLVAGPVALASKQIDTVAAAARSRGRVLMFDTGHLGDERIAFVRKMASGPQVLWRPRYVRSLRTGADADTSLDELAIADISAVLSLLGGTPSRVSAIAPRVDDETGTADAAMVTMMFEGGPAARVDVSLMEPEPRHEVVVACDGRTVVLDAFDVRAPIKITAVARHRGPQLGAQWAETITEHPAPDQDDRLHRAASAFAAAVRARDMVASNAGEIASATLVWEAARASMTAGGELTDVAPPGAANTERPVLQMIVGGGHTTESEAPELTVIARREA